MTGIKGTKIIIIDNSTSREDIIEELIEEYNELYEEYIREKTQRNYILGAYESLRKVVESGAGEE